MDRASSTNGQALIAYLEGARKALNGLSVVDYYRYPLPSELDNRLREITRAFSAFSLPQRSEWITGLTALERSLFGIFAHRAATIAIRQADPDWLRLGLMGNVIANYEIPPKREVVRSLAIFYHCAQQMNISPRDLFDEAASFAGEEMARHLRSFGRRTDVSLKQYGWREVRSPDGITFKFEW